MSRKPLAILTTHQPVSPVDPRLLDFHRKHNAPVTELLERMLLTLELRREDLSI